CSARLARTRTPHSYPPIGPQLGSRRFGRYPWRAGAPHGAWSGGRARHDGAVRAAPGQPLAAEGAEGAPGREGCGLRGAAPGWADAALAGKEERRDGRLAVTLGEGGADILGGRAHGGDPAGVARLGEDRAPELALGAVDQRVRRDDLLERGER